MRNFLARAFLGAAIASCGLVYATSNIDPGSPYAWGENIGWINMQGDGTNGVVVTADNLSGYAWAENAGWIYFGDLPNSGTQYTQAAGDTGVNNDGAGNLSGYAWGENIGWINFDTSGAGGSQVTVDMVTGQFDGYAWCESVGWINMNSGYGVVADFGTTSVADWSILD